MKRLAFVILAFSFFAAPAAAEDNPWAAWPYRLTLRVTHPEVSDFTGMARVRVNLGAASAKDYGDVRILDDKSREQPWRLVATTSSGEADIVFHAVKGCADYTLIFGVPGKSRPDYGVPLKIGRTLIDDSIPRRSHTHGLWEWVVSPVISGAFAHTSPLVERCGYHGTSEMNNVDIESGDVLQTYVWIDPERPPQEIQMRLAFAHKAEEGDWEHKDYVVVYWGKKTISNAISGMRLSKGELPAAGRWQPLEVDLGDLVRRAGRGRDGSEAGWLYGINFATDRGRAYWDMTSIGPMPAETEVVALDRTAAAAPVFVWQKLGALKPAGSDAAMAEVRFIGSDRAAAWDFGDGTSSDAPAPVHVFQGADIRKVTMKPADGTPCVRDVEGLKGSAPTVGFAVELASCPFVARADDKALFNLRLEGSPPRVISAEARAVLLDSTGKELRRESAPVKLYPGDKHPAFQAFSLDASAPELAKVRFELAYGGRVLASREAAVRSSASPLDGLSISGDRYVDGAGTPVVVRAEVAQPGADPAPERKVSASRVLVIGRMFPFASDSAVRIKLSTEERIKELKRENPGLTLPDNLTVRELDVDVRPSWSMPSRLLLAAGADRMEPAPDVVLIVVAWEMMQAGVPVRSACDALGACVDQARRRSKAEVVLVTPAAVSGCEDLAHQYAVALRLLGIEKNASVVDLYSRSVRLGSESPEALKACRVDAGVLVREVDARLVRMTLDAVVEELLHPSASVRAGD